MRWRAIAILVLAVSGHALDARAEDEPEPPNPRRRLALAVSGGAAWMSDAPGQLDVAMGGQLGARVMVDLDLARAEASFVIPDASRPERFQLRADGRLLFVSIHELTLRRTGAGELLRLFAGIGGDVDLPDGAGALGLGLGFAMNRLGAFDDVERPMSEAYGGYVGLTLRLRVGEVQNDLRVAVHAMMPPPSLALSLDFGPEQLFAGLEPGVTASNRLYVQALREGSFSAGPQLDAQLETMFGGVVLLWTLGIAGTLGI
ncbi:MAG: hypothetical protein KF729_25735 [Sandaracinaceae bacterium]|nr:hypothetical protein [Sandaracinaceae bacterium]